MNGNMFIVLFGIDAYRYWCSTVSALSPMGWNGALRVVVVERMMKEGRCTKQCGSSVRYPAICQLWIFTGFFKKIDELSTMILIRGYSYMWD